MIRLPTAAVSTASFRGGLHGSNCYRSSTTSSLTLLRSLSSSSSTKKDTVVTTPKGTPYTKLTIGIPRETYPLEKRVAATPESVSKLVKPGFTVLIESGAGQASHFNDADYEAAGAVVVKGGEEVWSKSDIVMKVCRNKSSVCIDLYRGVSLTTHPFSFLVRNILLYSTLIFTTTYSYVHQHPTKLSY
jgi:hypothetical protein